MRLQTLELRDAENVFREAATQLSQVDGEVAAAERRLEQASTSMVPGALIDMASFLLMSELGDQQLMQLGALCVQREAASDLVESGRANLMKEHHRQNVLERLRTERAAQHEHHLSNLADKDASDLWVTGRFNNVRIESN